MYHWIIAVSYTHLIMLATLLFTSLFTIAISLQTAMQLSLIHIFSQGLQASITVMKLA